MCEGDCVRVCEVWRRSQCELTYCIAGFFVDIYFREFHENIFREILGATPSSRAKTTHAHA